jgi:anaphase-promoting complex subunit 10
VRLSSFYHSVDGLSTSLSTSREPIRAHLIQIAIISNHMNGKDTHVRGIRVFSPKPFVLTSSCFSLQVLTPVYIHRLDLEDDLLPFRTVAFQQHETIR